MLCHWQIKKWVKVSREKRTLEKLIDYKNLTPRNHINHTSERRIGLKNKIDSFLLPSIQKFTKKNKKKRLRTIKPEIFLHNKDTPFARRWVIHWLSRLRIWLPFPFHCFKTSIWNLEGYSLWSKNKQTRNQCAGPRTRRIKDLLLKKHSETKITESHARTDCTNKERPVINNYWTQKPRARPHSLSPISQRIDRYKWI